MASRILFVGKNDSRLARTWSRVRAKGYDVAVVRSRKPALELIEINPPRVVVVDMTVPRTGAEKLCQTLKKHRPSIPILLLVDDEQCPPKIPHERTLSRAASYRRFSSALSKLLKEHPEHMLRIGSLSLDLATHVVHSLKGTTRLCPKEVQLLATFMHHSGKVLRHGFLMKEIWGTDFVDDLGTLWTHVSSLRRKIEPYRDRRVYLYTIRGIGYRLDVCPAPAGE